MQVLSCFLFPQQSTKHNETSVEGLTSGREEGTVVRVDHYKVQYVQNFLVASWSRGTHAVTCSITSSQPVLPGHLTAVYLISHGGGDDEEGDAGEDRTHKQNHVLENMK